VARNFGLFLKSNMQEENNNVMCVLKSINQAVLAPAIIALKMALPGLPFKDYRNSWRVKIFIGNDESVDVVHVRREQSFGTQNEEMKFEFVWELRVSIALGSKPGGGDGGLPNQAIDSPAGSVPHSGGSIISDHVVADNNNNDNNNNNNNNNNNKHIQRVTLQIMEVAFGLGVPQHNKEKVLGDMERLLSSNCVITTIAAA